jgi:hypothetical protein
MAREAPPFVALVNPGRRRARFADVQADQAANKRGNEARGLLAQLLSRGIPRTTVDGWYRDRARTDYPEKAGRVGRTDYWYEDEWTAWYEGHLRGKVGSLTEVDRGGDRDDLVDAAEAARMLGYSSRYVIHANRRLGYFPVGDVATLRGGKGERATAPVPAASGPPRR